MEQTQDDLDLTALAELFTSGNAICERLLVYPYPVSLNGDSVSDQWQACDAAVRAGKSIPDILRAIAAAGGGTAVLWWLMDDAGVEQAPDPEQSPEPQLVGPVGDIWGDEQQQLSRKLARIRDSPSAKPTLSPSSARA